VVYILSKSKVELELRMVILGLGPFVELSSDLSAHVLIGIDIFR